MNFKDIAKIIVNSIPKCYYSRLPIYNNSKSYILDISKPNRQEIKEEIEKELKSLK